MKMLPSRLLAAALLLALYIGGQAVWANIMHHQFQDDVNEAAAQIGGKIGLKPPSSDDDLRARIVRDAETAASNLRHSKSKSPATSPTAIGPSRSPSTTPSPSASTTS
jgi:hypothetical protein